MFIAKTGRILTSRLPPRLIFNDVKRTMAVVPFKLADIGEGIAEVELLKWFVKDGDKVKAFDRICEVQSDKATVEITSRFDGTITKVHYSEGAIVKVGAALVDIDTAAAVSSKPATKAAAPASASAPITASTSASTAGSTSIVPFKLADIGEGIAEVELMKWFVKAGDTVKAFDRICEVQSDKATVEITSRFDGVIRAVHHSEGSIVKVGAALVDIETVAAGGTTGKKLVNEPSDPVLPASSHYKPSSAAGQSAAVSLEKVLTTPAVRKIAKENQVDLTQVRGTGPKGRVLKEDILLYLQNRGRGIPNLPPVSAPVSSPVSAPVSAPASAPTPISAPTPVPVVSGVDQRVPIRGVQRLMVKSMTAALQVQHLTYCEEINFDALKQLRSELKSSMAKRNIKLSYMPLMIKAASLALLQFPQLNATVNSEVTEVVYHANHNIGVAMDTAKGLVVPVLRSVQAKSLAEIAQELQVLQDAALKGTLTEAQLQGGTFTLSNIGSIGGTYAVPVLVVPQVMIGAFGRLQTLPRYVNSRGQPATVEQIEDGEAQVCPATLMNVSWSADHRVVDGATVAKFSNVWKKYLEHPASMLSDLR